MSRLILVTIAVLALVQVCNAEIYKYVTEDGIVVFSDVPPNGESELVHKKVNVTPVNKPVRRSVPADNMTKYYPIVRETAQDFSLDPELIGAMITVESNWQPSAVSRKGAMGLMQLMPKTADSLSVGNPFDPHENITGGVRYFRMLLDYFKGSLRRALAAYNAGPTRVSQNAYFPEGHETRNYVNKILSLYGGESKFKYRPMEGNLSSEPIYRLILEDGTLMFTNTFPTAHGISLE